MSFFLKSLFVVFVVVLVFIACFVWIGFYLSVPQDGQIDSVFWDGKRFHNIESINRFENKDSQQKRSFIKDFYFSDERKKWPKWVEIDDIHFKKTL